MLQLLSRNFTELVFVTSFNITSKIPAALISKLYCLSFSISDCCSPPLSLLTQKSKNLLKDFGERLIERNQTWLLGMIA